jgi:hypothetical protein
MRMVQDLSCSQLNNQWFLEFLMSSRQQDIQVLAQTLMLPTIWAVELITLFRKKLGSCGEHRVV